MLGWEFTSHIWAGFAWAISEIQPVSVGLTFLTKRVEWSVCVLAFEFSAEALPRVVAAAVPLHVCPGCCCPQPLSAFPSPIVHLGNERVAAGCCHQTGGDAGPWSPIHVEPKFSGASSVPLGHPGQRTPCSPRKPGESSSGPWQESGLCVRGQDPAWGGVGGGLSSLRAVCTGSSVASSQCCRSSCWPPVSFLR